MKNNVCLNQKKKDITTYKTALKFTPFSRFFESVDVEATYLRASGLREAKTTNMSPGEGVFVYFLFLLLG